MLSASHRGRKGFSLIELLVVLGFIAVLFGLLIPAVQRAREASGRATCQNHLKQLGLAFHQFESVHRSFPIYHGVMPNGKPWLPENRNLVYGSWFTHLLPQVEQDALYRTIHDEIQKSGMNEPSWAVPPSSSGGPIVENYNGHEYVYIRMSGGSGWSAHGIWIDGVHDATFRVLQCPSDPTRDPTGLVYQWWGSTNYLANFNVWSSGRSGLWQKPPTIASISDGISNTLLLGEGYANCDRIGRVALFSWYFHNFGLDWYQQSNTWMFQNSPTISECDNWRAQSGHRAGMNIALADGSVRFLPPSISQSHWTNLLLPQDGKGFVSEP